MRHIIPLKRAFLICLLVLLSISPSSIASAGNNVWTSTGPADGTFIDPLTNSHNPRIPRLLLWLHSPHFFETSEVCETPEVLMITLLARF